MRVVNLVAGLAIAVLLLLKTVTSITLAAPPVAAIRPGVSNAVLRVRSAVELQLALITSRPGQVIELRAGIYRGSFAIGVSGTAEKPITLRGIGQVVIDAGSTGVNYGLLIRGSHWRIENLAVRNAKKGIVLHGASHNVLRNVRVTDVGEEGIRLRAFSRDNVLSDCSVSFTGRQRPGYGEGIYIGTAGEQWPTMSGGQPDRSDGNQVLNCRFGPEITAEHIDIKEGTSGGRIAGNQFDGAGISGQNYADSWMDIKGNDYRIDGNTAFNRDPSALADGFQTHVKSGGWGRGNVFSNNTLTVNAGGYGFNIQIKNEGGGDNRVENSNVVNGAAKGFSNIAPVAVMPQRIASDDHAGGRP